MPKQSDQKTDEVFSKLPNYGYSERVAALIWRWYHPSMKMEQFPNEV
ncbi:MAG: hypothetical protein ABSA79_04220 [Candidatus Bathyarchaeia archaeon]|jgi:predicted Ser/Thr protein kinase